GPNQGGAAQGDGHRHVAAGTEELDTDRARVLHDEIDQSHAQKHGDDDRDPGRADAGAVDAVLTPPSAMSPASVSRLALWARGRLGLVIVGFAGGHEWSLPISTAVVTRRSTVS